VLVIVLAIFAGRTLLNRTRTSSGELAQGIPSLKQGKYVAILPLKQVGDQKTLGYVADGIQEALAAKLFQLKEVHLASSDAWIKRSAKDLPLNKLARALGVNLILQGSVQGNSDQLRVTLSLDDASTGKRLWSQEFPGAAGDVLALEDQIYGTRGERPRPQAHRRRAGPRRRPSHREREGLRSLPARAQHPAQRS
jgi:TolB-like protein